MTAWSTRLAKSRYDGDASRAQSLIRRLAVSKARIVGLLLVLATLVTKPSSMPLIWRLNGGRSCLCVDTVGFEVMRFA